jgi:hypothetical protein
MTTTDVFVEVCVRARRLVTLDPACWFVASMIAPVVSRGNGSAMTPQHEGVQFVGNEGGAERWVKWFAGIALPAVVAMASVMINDHVELAVMRSKQDDVIVRTLEKNDRMLTLLEKIVEQHRDMITRQDRIMDRLDSDTYTNQGRQERATPVFPNGRRFENK